jgi:hypothetical protein
VIFVFAVQFDQGGSSYDRERDVPDEVIPTRHLSPLFALVASVVSLRFLHSPLIALS